MVSVCKRQMIPYHLHTEKNEVTPELITVVLHKGQPWDQHPIFRYASNQESAVPSSHIFKN